jgi:methylthioribose-1-phosphate isomerase
VRLEEDRVVLLDQRRLPDEEVEVECRSAREVAEAIRTMVVRGAPAIGVAAAYGYALAARTGRTSTRRRRCSSRAAHGRQPPVGGRADASSRRRSRRAARATSTGRGRALPAHGRARGGLLREGSTPLTHCNAGGLATGGYGSALGAVKAGFERGLVEHVFVDETRPLLQGGRLTAWELERAGIPASVIADSAAARSWRGGDHARDHRRRPHRAERRHGEQDRHVRSRRARRPSRHSRSTSSRRPRRSTWAAAQGATFRSRSATRPR